MSQPLTWCLALCTMGTVLAHTIGPTATTLNGTYEGIHLPGWNQDVFLGIPFAQPPVGNLRYRHPQSLTSSFNGTRHADLYGFSCMQYDDTQNLDMSEDCLTLNIIRPSGIQHPLPVLVWIYGGGLGIGSTADPRYNLSGIVQVAEDAGKPFVAVSMNYRVSHWGFLQSSQTLAEGSSNAGLLDQRLALRWIQENISGFGGDPGQVILWGESAGAQSIAYHMLSYGGRDDGLFHGAILESGGPTGAPVKDLAYWKAPLENLTRSVGCHQAEDGLACLRRVDEATLYAARQTQEWQGPLIDGDFLTGYPSQLFPQGGFIKVPLMIGSNTDEGITFDPGYVDIPEQPLLNSEKDLFDAFLSWRGYNLSPKTIETLMDLYPLKDCNQPPLEVANCSTFPAKGRQWRRAASIGGDLVMIAGRRKMCETFSDPDVNQTVYSYRFDTRLWGRSRTEGVQHFDNVAFSFQNITGLLGPHQDFASHAGLARAIGTAYANFVHHFNPNGGISQCNTDEPLPYWPRYSLAEPRNMVLNASKSWVESDTYRREGIEFINSREVSRELLG